MFSAKWLEGTDSDYSLAYSLFEFEAPITRAIGERCTVNRARMTILRLTVPGHF